MSTRPNGIVLLDPNQLWWVHWRIRGPLCGRTLYPVKTDQAVNIMEKTAAVFGKKNVWMEKDNEPAASPAAPGI